MHKASEMSKQKFHALDHLPEAVTHVGGNDTLHAERYGALHKQFKAMCALSSRRKRSAMNEILVVRNSKNSRLLQITVNTNIAHHENLIDPTKTH